MRKHFIFVLAVVALVAIFRSVRGDEPKEAQRMLCHDVYFSLNDSSPLAKQKHIAACKKYLKDHSGAVWFAVGPLAEEMKRDVNDREFDVAMHLVFKDKVAYDQYAKSERHQTFIKETQATWKKVRVFDSYVDE